MSRHPKGQLIQIPGYPYQVSDVTNLPTVTVALIFIRPDDSSVITKDGSMMLPGTNAEESGEFIRELIKAFCDKNKLAFVGYKILNDSIGPDNASNTKST